MLLVDMEIQCWVRLETFFILLRTEFTRQQNDSHLFRLLDSRPLPFEVRLLLDGLALDLVLLVTTLLTHLSQNIIYNLSQVSYISMFIL